MPGTPKTDRLTQYRKKRKAEATPEPFGEASAERPYLFVIQKHAARRTHYDLRLEWNGTLISWAVPNGPSLDPSEKRLAVHVEDHPVEYADFEGVIPAGNYGAGAVILWDRGRWVPIDDPDQLEASGKLHFELHGYKLRGEWILVRTKRGPKDWLLYKKKDAWARPGEPPFGEESILSGLTVEELGEGKTGAREIASALGKLKAKHGHVDPAKLELMLCETAEKAFSGKDWLFELKYDGYRMIAARTSDGVPYLRYRNGNDVTAIFPEIAKAVRALPCGDAVLDGEAVVLDETGKPSFARLQQRGQIRRARDAERAAVEHPVTLVVFDLLGLEGHDLRGLPLTRRKELLRKLVPKTGALRYSDHVEARGEELFERVRDMGLEGLIAKKADAPYRGGRSNQWLKLVADRSGDFVVVGYTAGKGGRGGFGALHVGAYLDDGRLVYCGRAGSGFNARQLEEMGADLEAIARDQPACIGSLPVGHEHHWVEPRMVVEVRYKTWTTEGLLRHPVFSRVREDKKPEECLYSALPGPRPDSAVAGNGPPPKRSPFSRGKRVRVTDAPAQTPEPEPEGPPEIKFTNLTKIFWPAERYTKGDLIDYYRSAWPWLEPYLMDRPCVLTRYPDGIEGKSFYQKDAPTFLPDWIRRAPIWSEDGQKDIRYIVCEDETTMAYLANLGTIPLHIWHSRVETLQRPDWCLVDLDPKGAPFSDVILLARAVHELCEDIGLPSLPKTTGSTGIHILIPLGRQLTYEQSRMLGNLLARVIHDQHPKISTIQRMISSRGGKVYLDYLQNRHGQLMVTPFSVRPLPGATVSMPLTWEEVNPKLENGRFTIKNAIARMEKLGKDPMRAVLEMKPDLTRALARLAGRVGNGEG
ncbi:MAG TPA: DNA ligase D [Candidatus Eisenbacteria bacterium]|nr:DNA ligase D [Candidatus Eisenbacteria bacterium]